VEITLPMNLASKSANVAIVFESDAAYRHDLASARTRGRRPALASSGPI